MKKFSSLNEEVKTKYELKDSLRNEIYSLIENTIFLKFNSEDSVDINVDLTGKEELVEKIKTLIDEVRIKERTSTLESVKANVHRNFDMKWLNEQIEILKKKNRSNLILFEDIQNVDSDLINYFVNKLHEIKKIGNFEFEYEPHEGVFKFIDDDDDLVVVATPFYNNNSGVPIEVFDEHNMNSHIFIEQRELDTKKALFDKYIEIMRRFLIDEFDEWMNKVDKFDANNI